ncbi:MAG: hypothetical protein HOH17_02680 [Halieaceae bacterium]|nr:hypothetical protein [Halieaceae bacterium]
MGIGYAQWIKLAVYSLLLINFGNYMLLDINQVNHTYHEGWRWFDWTSAFATTLDELGWFVLLLLLELETYILSDAAFTRFWVRCMKVVRFLCYLVIGHAVVAYTEYLYDLLNSVEHVGASLCSFVDQGLSAARNLEYQVLDAGNCKSFSTETTFYIFSQGQVITDAAGMRVEFELAWADIIEVLFWLLILALIEVRLQLQDRGISRSRLLSFAENAKVFLYGTLWLIAGYWAFRGHWLFAWDEALWILGFMAIGMNLSQWREEIEAKKQPA